MEGRIALALCTAVVGLLIGPVNGNAAEMRCDFASRHQCSSHGGCAPVNSSDIYVKLRLDTDQYGRCDNAGCDWYAITAQISGIYQHFGFANVIAHPGVAVGRRSPDAAASVGM